jgi:tetratricopeptide (TPR) repeat protein
LECNILDPSDNSKLCRNHHRLGDLYERDDNWEESINHLEKSRDLCQGSEEKNLVPVLLSLSRVYFKAKRYDDALLSNKELVSHQSDSTSLADVFHSMGQAYMKLSQYDESREYLNKSLSIHRALRDSKETCIARILVDLAEINELVDDFEAASDCLVEVSDVYSFILSTLLRR